MQRRLKLILLCLGLLLPGGSFAQEADTSIAEETYAPAPGPLSADEDYASEDFGETEDARPPRVIVYNKQTPGEARWLEATSDDAYSYRTTREYVPRPEVPRRPDPAWVRWIADIIEFFVSITGQIILWTLLIIILGYIGYRVIAGDGRLFSRRDVKTEAAGDPGELSEAGLMELNWESRMREALAAGDPRGAIRFGYLHLLQQLHTRQLITFRPEKTNINYYRELSAGFRPAFRSLTRVYEFAWYGNYVPDAAGMSAFIDQLEDFLHAAPRT